HCPASFLWRGETYRIVEKLKEWHDYRRRGRMAHNMRPAHAAAARRRGSWGVGRDYYRVRTEDGRVFDLYFDRAPRHAGDRTGEWFLYREMGEDDRQTGQGREPAGRQVEPGDSSGDGDQAQVVR
ncbi:MAG: DUF6504 family protein, partial [Chloroflexota bacterium]